MYLVGLIIVLAVGITADKPKDFKKCHHLFRPGIEFCCTSKPKENFMTVDLEECSEIPHTLHPTCEVELCFAKKKGFAKDDGTIDKTELTNLVEKHLENEPELLELIKDKCIDGDLDIFGPPDSCDLHKMKNCVIIQFISQCPEFSDKNGCKEVKELVQECVEIFS